MREMSNDPNVMTANHYRASLMALAKEKGINLP
jgi:hypothetical protein